jgi:hypothetical protein
MDEEEGFYIEEYSTDVRRDWDHKAAKKAFEES